MEGLKRPLLLLFGLTLLLRLPFLSEAIQGDDHIYLTEAAHAQIEPLHPANTHYVFLGDDVDLRGHSHPPLNGWILAAILGVVGDVREVPFHAAYILFSLIAVWAMWSLGCSVWAVLLFLAVPAFVVNGGSLEADLPFLAFWMASIALFTSEQLWWAVVAMVLAGLAAYQAVLLTPILAVYVWMHHRKSWRWWLATMTPPLTIIAWQAFERVTTGAWPAVVLATYFSHYKFQATSAKLQSAIALAIHSWFIVFPALIPPAAIAAWRKRRDPDTQFLLAWIAIFAAGSVVLFFAGSARYLLPMAAPVCLLASRLPARWLAPAFALQLVLALALASVNYQHWNRYRRFAHTVNTEGHRVWIDDAWGLRHYLERERGGRPLLKTQKLRAGDMIIESVLGHSVQVSGPRTLVAKAEIRPRLPLRLIGLESHSGYSTVSRGFWPFGVSSGPIDEIRVWLVNDTSPKLTYLPMNAPDADHQIVSGIYGLEDNRFRWMGRRATVLLKSPDEPTILEVNFTIPDRAPARQVALLLDGAPVASETYTAPGTYTLKSNTPVRGSSVEIEVDRTFFVPPDQRELGIVLTAVGFR
jgi:hypothetical protein